MSAGRDGRSSGGGENEGTGGGGVLDMRETVPFTHISSQFHRARARRGPHLPLTPSFSPLTQHCPVSVDPAQHCAECARLAEQPVPIGPASVNAHPL